MALQSLQIPRRRLAEDVYDQLVSAIRKREIGPDDVLVQEKLAAEMQISRTPVREALMRLEQEGVLEVSKRGSFRLYQMSDAEVEGLYQARLAVEGHAMRLLAEQADAALIAHLTRVITKAEAITTHDAWLYFEANRIIHRAIVEATNNPVLIDMCDMIWGKGQAFHLFAAIENINLAQSLGDHMTLVDAIARGGPARAFEAMRKHIDDGLELQLEGLHTSS